MLNAKEISNDTFDEEETFVAFVKNLDFLEENNP